MYKFIYICLISLMFSCASRTDCVYIAPSYPLEHEIEIKPLNKSVLLTSVMNMYLCDTTLLLQGKNVDNSNVFHSFSITDGHYIGSFANYGRGPNELNSYNCAALSHNNKYLYVLDDNGKYLTINIPNSVVSRKIDVVASGMIGRHNTTMTMFAMNNNRLMHCGGRTRVFSTDDNYTDTISIYNEYPYIQKKFEEDSVLRKSYFNINTLYTLQPDNRRLACATRYGMLLDILQLNDNGAKSIATRRFYQPKMENDITPKDDCVLGATQIYSTNEYIYLLYRDAIEIDRYKSKRIMGIFDWDGNEVALYRFNDNVRNIVISSDNKRMYCWVQKSDGEEYLGYFDLKWI